ncbi:MAG: RluA family pseudouridine synthase [Bacteroidales bacterium]|nr:RluA family pseudouridine synthase [Bacteroidales bacterium]
MIHSLSYNGLLPETFNNPFDYVPHPVCEAAVADLLPQVEALMKGNPEGKMFGVLVVTKEDSQVSDNQQNTTLYYLAAFSGQLYDKSVLPGFVPPVFDFLDPDGYFKQHEAEISAINQEIDNLKSDGRYIESRKYYRQLQNGAEVAIAAAKQKMLEAKTKRDAERSQRMLTAEEEAAFVKESQFLKAELRREKKHWSEAIAEAKAEVDVYEQRIDELANQRKIMSEALQNWLFEHFVMVNYAGERRNLLDIFRDTVQQLPPSGTGECCEPKLLQYAYTHGLKPVQMAMFWWGKSPEGEIRHHLHYYPACSGKCKPVLTFMLPPEVLTANLHRDLSEQLEIVYEDTDLWVVNKPSGMLSVPGKSHRESVISILQEHCQEGETPLVVHRLDMDTSGLLVVAKHKTAHYCLQKQFRDREIHKTYVAVLDGEPLPIGEEGRIELSLFPDLMHRPFQKVDKAHGKPAVTLYRVVGEHVVELHPLTGRTHQLRVHCAHSEGLGCPIKGDNLYGCRADRLYLHAARIAFVHPGTGEEMVFVRKADFLRDAVHTSKSVAETTV